MNVDAKNLKQTLTQSIMCHFVTLPVRMALFIGFGDQNQVAAGGVVVNWVEFVVLFN